jgi:hypothetical protein
MPSGEPGPTRRGGRLRRGRDAPTGAVGQGRRAAIGGRDRSTRRSDAHDPYAEDSVPASWPRRCPGLCSDIGPVWSRTRLGPEQDVTAPLRALLAGLTILTLATTAAFSLMPPDVTLPRDPASYWGSRFGQASVGVVHTRPLLRRTKIVGARIATLYNHAKLGGMAPGRREIIDVDPTRIGGSFDGPVLRRLFAQSGYSSGVVVDGDWDLYVQYHDFAQKLVYEACRMRWVAGRPWEDTELFQIYQGRLERGEPCRFATYDALVERYRTLDTIYEQVVREGRLREEPEHLVKISVVRDGRLIWGPNGRHRVSIALIAGLHTMPARVGYVHMRAVELFQSFRRRKRGCSRPEVLHQ